MPAVVDTRDELIVRERESIRALANRCTRRGGPPHGTVRDGCATCLWHLSTFALEDGAVVRGPATAPQPANDVRVRWGTVDVRSRP